jgi:hypothetical protein
MVGATPNEGGVMAEKAPKSGPRHQGRVKHGYGKTFEEAVESTLSPTFRRGQESGKHAEVIFTEMLVENPDVIYHVVVRFPEN